MHMACGLAFILVSASSKGICAHVHTHTDTHHSQIEICTCMHTQTHMSSSLNLGFALLAFCHC